MKKSFTLIELLVVISIMLIFIGGTLVQYNTFTEQTKLKNEAKRLVDVLELAKKKALSADLFDKTCTNFTGYKVTVALSSYSLSFGCAAVYTTVQSYNLPTNVTATVGGGNYIFTPLMNNPSFASGTITLKNANISKCVSITVTAIGVVSLNEVLVGC